MNGPTDFSPQDARISLFKTVLENSVDGVAILKAIRDQADKIIDFEYVFINKAGLSMLQKEGLVGKRLLEVFPEHLENNLFSSYVKVANDKTPEKLELYYGRPYNAWINFAIVPVEDGVSVSFQNNTEQKQIDIAAGKKAKRLGAFVKNLPLGAAHRLGNSLFINKKVEELLGFTQEEVTDIDTWFKLVHRDEVKLARRMYEEGKKNNFPVPVDVPFWTKSGKMLWLRMTAQRYAEGEVWLMQDITEQRLWQDALEESKNILRAIIESAIDGIITIDQAGKLASINPSACKLFGYKPEEIIGKNVKVLMPEPYHGEHDGYIKSYLNTGKQKIIGIGREVVGLKKDGSTFPFKLSVSEIQLDGRILFSGIIHDLTAQKEAEEKLRKHAEELEKEVARRTESLRLANQDLNRYAQELEEAQRVAKVGSWEWDIANNKAKWSDELFRIMGWKKEAAEIDVNDIIKLVHPEDRERVQEATEKAAREKTSIPLEYRIITPEGTEKHVFGTGGYELKNEAGEVTKLFGIIQDITDLKKTEKALVEALAQERELSELKSRFVSMASHEFRTPLATILTSVGLIDKYHDPSQQAKRVRHINRIKNNVQNMRNILDDFLSLSKLEEGKVQVRTETIDLIEFYAELIEDLQGQVKDGQLLIHNHKGPESITQLDPQLLQNINLNLISNAIKYSGEGKQIQINSFIDEHEVKIEVVDQGMGIPKEEQKHMFTRFFRAKNATNIQGTGLGLTIVQRYVELMNGSISFESIPEKGTTFTVSFPSLNSNG